MTEQVQAQGKIEANGRLVANRNYKLSGLSRVQELIAQYQRQLTSSSESDKRKAERNLAQLNDPAQLEEYFRSRVIFKDAKDVEALKLIEEINREYQAQIRKAAETSQKLLPEGTGEHYEARFRTPELTEIQERLDAGYAQKNTPPKLSPYIRPLVPPTSDLESVPATPDRASPKLSAEEPPALTQSQQVIEKTNNIIPGDEIIFNGITYVVKKVPSSGDGTNFITHQKDRPEETKTLSWSEVANLIKDGKIFVKKAELHTDHEFEKLAPMPEGKKGELDSEEIERQRKAELEDPDVTLEEAIEGRLRITDWGKQHARENPENTIQEGKALARTAFKYLLGQISALDFLKEPPHMYNTTGWTEDDAKKWADQEALPWKNKLGEIKAKYDQMHLDSILGPVEDEQAETLPLKPGESLDDYFDRLDATLGQSRTQPPEAPKTFDFGRDITPESQYIPGEELRPGVNQELPPDLPVVTVEEPELEIDITDPEQLRQLRNAYEEARRELKQIYAILDTQKELERKKAELKKKGWFKGDLEKEVAKLELRLDGLYDPFKYFVINNMGPKNFKIVFGVDHREVKLSDINKAMAAAAEVFEPFAVLPTEPKDKVAEREGVYAYSLNGFYVKTMQSRFKFDDPKAKFYLYNPSGAVVASDLELKEATDMIIQKAKEYHEEQVALYEQENL